MLVSFKKKNDVLLVNKKITINKHEYEIIVRLTHWLRGTKEIYSFSLIYLLVFVPVFEFKWIYIYISRRHDIDVHVL